VADYFQMNPLRQEALCVICQKATSQHLPLLQNVADTVKVEGLDVCLKQLLRAQTRQDRLHFA
jgi:hypothetical protein